MSEDMLGNIPLSEIRGPVNDLQDKLAGADGQKWLAALKKMLRGDNSWPEIPLWRKVSNTVIEVNLDAPDTVTFWVRETLFSSLEYVKIWLFN